MKVTLLGDSIRLNGYGTAVPQMLEGEFAVYQPTDNCRFLKHTIRGLLDWAQGIKGSDIIHWNNGCWDICDYYGDGPFTPIEDYVRDAVRLAKLLQQRARVVIFATTTPQNMPDDHPYNQKCALIMLPWCRSCRRWGCWSTTCTPLWRHTGRNI